MPGLSDVALDAEQLLGGVRVALPSAMAYTNVSDLNPDFGRHLLSDVYVPFEAGLDSIQLFRLPAGAWITGQGHFILVVDQVPVREQIPVYLAPHEVALAIHKPVPQHDIGDEVVLVARYGISTWGHWLAELLPKVVLVEAAHPGRFQFALPSHVWAISETPWCRIRESLEAYGITEKRILPLDETHSYVFSNLFAVSPIWSNDVMHPGATEMMRTRLCLQPRVGTSKRIAVRREAYAGRVLENNAAIEPLLAQAGFSFVATTSLPFLDQVGEFQGVDTLFAVLGSDCTNILYSPPGVRLITVAPAIFGDRFFYSLVLDRGGTQIDLRGRVTAPHSSQTDHRSYFEVDPNEVAKALAML